MRDRRTEPRGPSIGTTSLSSVGGLDEQSEDGGLQSMWTHGEQALQQRHAPHMFGLGRGTSSPGLHVGIDENPQGGGI